MQYSNVHLGEVNPQTEPLVYFLFFAFSAFADSVVFSFNFFVFVTESTSYGLISQSVITETGIPIEFPSFLVIMPLYRRKAVLPTFTMDIPYFSKG